MNKKLFFLLLSLPLYILSMEKEVDRNNTENNLSFWKLPNELKEKIFNLANHVSAAEIIETISTSLENIPEAKYKQDTRYIDNPDFIAIGNIIKNASVITYTRIALFIMFQKNLLKKEKQHFLSVMLMNDDLNENHRIILKFLSKAISEFRNNPIYKRGRNREATQESDIMDASISSYYNDPKEIGIVMKFLCKNNISFSQQTISNIINLNINKEQKIELIKYALAHGASIESKNDKGIKPLKHCKKYLAAWKDSNWTKGHEKEEDQRRYGHKIGISNHLAFHKNCAPDQETINQNIEYYKTLTALLKAYRSPKSTQNPDQDTQEKEHIN